VLKRRAGFNPPLSLLYKIYSLQMKKNLIRKRKMKHKNAYEYINSLPEEEQEYVWSDWLNSSTEEILICLFHHMPASVIRRDIMELRREAKEMV